MLDATGWTEFKTEEGLYEPYSSPFFYPDSARLQRVLCKITRGLFYWTAERRLPDDYVVLANPAVRPDEVPTIMDEMDAIGSFGPKPLDEYGVFKFMLSMEKGRTARSRWLMQFYDWAHFYTWTLPSAEVPRGHTGLPSFRMLEIHH
jgi:hypothetical protein